MSFAINREGWSGLTRRVLACLLVALLLCVSAFSSSALADEQPSSGETLQAQGDTASGTFANGSWNLDANGKLTINGNGQIPDYAYGNAPWNAVRDSITSVVVTGSVTTGKTAALFSECRNATSIDLTNMSIPDNVDLSRMFTGCSRLTDLKIPSTWSSHSAGNTSEMFYGCTSLQTLDISGLNTSKATNLNLMFYGCDSLTQVKVGSSFSFTDTGSNAAKSCTLPSNFASNRTGNWTRDGSAAQYTPDQIVSKFNKQAGTYNAVVASNYVTVYRVFNPSTSEHLFTTDTNEVKVLVGSWGWTYEGAGWFAPSTGAKVYRLFQASTNQHLYTTDSNEINVLTHNYDWIFDNNGQPLFYSSGDFAIYRLFNVSSLQHHYTTDSNEYNVLPTKGWGWQAEGQKLSCIDLGNTNYPYPSV